MVAFCEAAARRRSRFEISTEKPFSTFAENFVKSSLSKPVRYIYLNRFNRYYEHERRGRAAHN